MYPKTFVEEPRPAEVRRERMRVGVSPDPSGLPSRAMTRDDAPRVEAHTERIHTLGFWLAHATCCSCARVRGFAISR